MLVGTARDLLIGVTVVRADGVVAKAGGRVVKNVAGYDLGKLLVGSFGTLAVITEAVFRLHPEPEVRRWVTVDVDDPDRLHELAQAVIHSQAVPWAVEVDGPTDGALSVLLGGRPDGVDVARPSGHRPDRRRPSSDDRARRLGHLPLARRAQVGFKLTFALSGLRDVLAAARDAGGPRRVARPASGSRTPRADDATALESLRAVCALHGGTVVVVDAPAEVKRVVDVWGPVPGAGPDAPGEGPVRPRAPALAGPVRGRDLMEPGSRAGRRLRALRLLPADLPDLRAVGRGDGLAARPDPPDGAAPRGRAAHRRDGRPLGRLPGLHGVRDRVPVGRAVRQADRVRPAPRSSATTAGPRASGRCAG